ncbi:MAG: hypothetical protein AAFO91_04550, partial [Bacteroidota bacterium]
RITYGFEYVVFIVHRVCNLLVCKGNEWTYLVVIIEGSQPGFSTWNPTAKPVVSDPRKYK